MTSDPDARRHAPATARNRAPLAEVLAGLTASRQPARLVELASGTGEHAAWIGPRLAPWIWQPSDVDPDCHASIRAHCAGLATVRPPVTLDAADSAWPAAVPEDDLPVEMVLSVNMIHISPWASTEGLLAGAGRLLPAGGLLVVYGPFRRRDVALAPSNAAFDESLRARDPAWGLRELETVAETAAGHGLDLDRVIDMPANNLTVVWRR